MSYTFGSMPGLMLKENIMAGRPSRMKSYTDYQGMVIPVCGEFARKTNSIDPPPWMPAHSGVGLQRLSLHREIEHFVAYMKPTNEERFLRKDLVSRFTKLVARLNPKATVRPVGSYVTGLYLPTSDIDMVITFGLSSGAPLFSTKYDLSNLECGIRRSGFATKIESILQASVPLLRITDATTGIEIDLTAADEHGVKATEAVQSWMEEDSALISNLVMVIKLFLSIRRLGTTYTGGINSYLLVWMVVAWMKLEMPALLGSSASTSRQQRRAPDVDELTSTMRSLSVARSSISHLSSAGSLGSNSSSRIDLGSALISFLRFYGSQFSCTSRSIQFSSRSVSYGIKGYVYSRYPTQQYLLSITDPAESTIDMGSKAYAIKHVQETFREACLTLSSLVEGTANSCDLVKARVEGTLGCFLGGSYANFVDKRRRILDNYRRG